MRAPLTEQIPEYLQPYIVEQDVGAYTPIDHASWRFILKISKSFLGHHAHQKYIDGLQETGISTERIPRIEEMDQCLRKFNWRAVAVSGFIPPAVFMEFQSLGILPIACDMRTLEHLAYTPAPDIVHEAAGHAPIIADPEYSAYLRSFGELSRNAIYSYQDLDVYNAIRNLSIVKEEPTSTPEQIQAAQRRLDDAIAAVTYVSEATLLSRMGWWTFEYGLVGPIESPKIYGAGLMSSVGESYHCLAPEVRKIPFSIGCIDVSYDITRPQPQLFVARDFKQIRDALEELALMMAFRQGGVIGLEKAQQARTVTTTVLESGLQISGVLDSVLYDSARAPAYLQFKGPTQLAFQDQEIANQGPEHHASGFGSPLGKVRKFKKTPAELSDDELAALGFAAGAGSRDTKPGRMEFESGIVVEGKLKSKVRREGRNLVLAFEPCTVTRGAEVLFKPEWGTFDMACGAQVMSVFGGAADRKKYLAATGGFKQEPGKQKTNLTPENRSLNELYRRLRAIRDEGSAVTHITELSQIHEELEAKYPDDWLLRYELLEMESSNRLNAPWSSVARERLREIATQSKEKSELIARGMSLL